MAERRPHPAAGRQLRTDAGSGAKTAGHRREAAGRQRSVPVGPADGPAHPPPARRGRSRPAQRRHGPARGEAEESPEGTAGPARRRWTPAARRADHARDGSLAVRGSAAPAAGLRLLGLRGRVRRGADPEDAAAALPRRHHRSQRHGAGRDRTGRGRDRRPGSDQQAARRVRRRDRALPADDRGRAAPAAHQAEHPLRVPEEEGAGDDVHPDGGRPRRPEPVRDLPRERPHPHLPERTAGRTDRRLRRRRRQGPGGSGVQAEHPAGRGGGPRGVRERPERQQDPAGHQQDHPGAERPRLPADPGLRAAVGGPAAGGPAGAPRPRPTSASPSP